MDIKERNLIFKKAWKSSSKTNKGIFLKKIINTSTAKIYMGYSPDETYNYAIPSKKEINLTEIRKELDKINPKAGFYINEKNQKNGIMEFLYYKN